jgi:hypothetical protein
MDIGKLILDEIVGPAGAFFSVRGFGSFWKRSIPSQDSPFSGKVKNKKSPKKQLFWVSVVRFLLLG